MSMKRDEEVEGYRERAAWIIWQGRHQNVCACKQEGRPTGKVARCMGGKTRAGGRQAVSTHALLPNSDAILDLLGGGRRVCMHTRKSDQLSMLSCSHG